MSDQQMLLDALQACRQADLDAVIATVVKVEGSAYRRPGARMVVPQVGAPVGTVSGGCLENDVSRKAWWLTASQQPVVRTYTTGEDDDELEEAELSFGLGCNGTVHILFERVRTDVPSLVVELLTKVQATGQPAALATVIFSDAGSRVDVGARVAIDPAGALQFAAMDESLAREIQCDLQQVLGSGRTTTRRYVRRGGASIEVLLEYLAPPRRLVIFGAGHDAVPLLEIARLQGWRVSVVDARPHFARTERFPGAEQVILAPLEEGFSLHEQVDDAAVVIMTHSYSQDRHWLAHLLRCAPRYIGQLGPRSRTERLLAEIDDPELAQAVLSRLHYPVGLDIGGDSPHSVALSIFSEINAALNQRPGGMLKHRRKSIHSVETLDDFGIHDPAQRTG